MSNNVFLWLTALSLIGLTSCHKQRLSKNKDQLLRSDSIAVAANSGKSDSILSPDITELAEPVKIQEISFDYLVAKSKFSFESKGQNFDNATVNIRMKKDSLIWISVTGIGFEVARGLITPDSIVFMDKLHKQYFVFNYAQLSKQYNFDLNFPLLQSIIIGNLPFSLQPEDKFAREGNFFLLRQDTGRIQIANFIADNTLKLTRLQATETPTNNTFTLDYEDFKPVKNFLFPFSSLFKLNVKMQKDQLMQQTTVQIKHNKVDLVAENPGFPFSVPSSYSRKR